MITGFGAPVIYAKKSIRNRIPTWSSSIPVHGHVPALIDVCLLFVCRRAGIALIAFLCTCGAACGFSIPYS